MGKAVSLKYKNRGWRQLPKCPGIIYNIGSTVGRGHSGKRANPLRGGKAPPASPPRLRCSVTLLVL